MGKHVLVLLYFDIFENRTRNTQKKSSTILEGLSSFASFPTYNESSYFKETIVQNRKDIRKLLFILNNI